MSQNTPNPKSLLYVAERNAEIATVSAVAISATLTYVPDT
jgi:hypothetical protein